MKLMKCLVIILFCLILIFVSSEKAIAQCSAGGGPNKQPGLAGNFSRYHSFTNQCLAQPGTEVTITIEAMADLGCFAFDATHDPPSGSGCPDECASPPCCDTDPEDKYLTVSANGNWLSPAITGSSNMPASGRFFAEWAGNCTPYSDTCNEAGRSLCDGAADIFPNRRVVTIPASVWNSWLGASGNTMTIRVAASSAVSSSSPAEYSLAVYCYDLGFNQCPSQGCDGRCGPDTYSKVTISYTEASYCTNDTDCDDGLFCNGAEYCDGNGECRNGNPACGTGLICCESSGLCNEVCCDDSDCPVGMCNPVNDECFRCRNDNDCDYGEYCNDGVCSAAQTCTSDTECVAQSTVECVDYSCATGTEFTISVHDGSPHYTDSGDNNPWKNSNPPTACSGYAFRVAHDPPSSWGNGWAKWRTEIGASDGGYYEIQVGYQGNKPRSQNVKYIVEITDVPGGPYYYERYASQYKSTLTYCAYSSLGYIDLPSGCTVTVTLDLAGTAPAPYGFDTYVIADNVKFIRQRTCIHNTLPDGEPCDDGLFCATGDECNNGLCVASSTNMCQEGYVCDEGRDSCLADCDGNGIPDEDDLLKDHYLLAVDFDNGIPGDWSTSGLWHATSSCAQSNPCGSAPWAYFGQDASCDFDNGFFAVGSLTSPELQISAAASSVTLTYCSIYDGEGGIAPNGVDAAWVTVNGEVVDDVSHTAPQGMWETRSVDLSAYSGQSVVIDWEFNSRDGRQNDTLGWQVDDVVLVVENGYNNDCNGNSVPDNCDISSATSADCNYNAIPDECDISTAISDDCNGNGIPDECDIVPGGVSQDCNNNSIPDECDAVYITRSSPDLSPIYSGANQSYVFQAPREAISDVTFQFNAVGDLEYRNEYIGIQLNGSNVGRIFADLSCVACPSVNSDQITISNQNFNALLNSGTDVEVSMLPIANVGNECVDGSYINVTMSYEGTGDCDGNGTLDVCDIASGSATDCNSNGIPDECDISTAVSEDCNGNAVPDECDIAAGGGSQDRNGNSIPDECDAPDADDDEDVDLADFAVFQQCFGATTNADDCLTAFERVLPDSEINIGDYEFFESGLTGPQPAPVPAAMAAPMAMASSAAESSTVPPSQPDPWISSQAGVTLSVQPVGGGSPLTVLAPNTTYELHYIAGYSRANLYVLAVFADSAAQGWSAASAPATGQWASADVFEFNQNTPPASGSGPWMTDVAVGFWFGSTSYAGATEHLCTFTTGSAGNITVELDLSWIDDAAREMVWMQTANTFIVQ